MSECITCGAKFVGTPEQMPPDQECKYCQIQRLKVELAKAEAAAAEMRHLLEQIAAIMPGSDIAHALSSDCGRGWLSPEKAKRLREALEDISGATCARDHPEIDEHCLDASDMRKTAEKAIAETEDK